MKKGLTGTAILMVLVAIFAVINLVVGISGNYNDHTAQITVTDKERVVQEDSSRYLIMGEDENGKVVVYENTDRLLRGKFNSSDIYAAMKKGKTYEVQLVGYRFPMFSWYENILSYKEFK